MIKTLICGINGAMGRVLCECIEDSDLFTLECGYDLSQGSCGKAHIYNSLKDITEPIDVVIDFSHNSATKEITDWCRKNKLPLVSAVTGIDDDTLLFIKEASKTIPIFRADNFSYGISVLKRLLTMATQMLSDGYDIELIEAHHNKKVDSPSGTANMLLDTIDAGLKRTSKRVYGRHGNDTKREKNDIGVHSIRAGSLVGEHEVLFCAEGEVITLKHSALSKKVLAEGALRAASYIVTKSDGFYDMEDMLDEQQ